jgi:hypothetical protein
MAGTEPTRQTCAQEQESNTHGAVLHPRQAAGAHRFPPAGLYINGERLYIRIILLDNTYRMAADGEVRNPPLYRAGTARFSGRGEAVPSAQEAGRPRAAPAPFPSASDRLFLSGLPARRARLRFTGCPPFGSRAQRFVNRG